MRLSIYSKANRYSTYNLFIKLNCLRRQNIKTPYISYTLFQILSTLAPYPSLPLFLLPFFFGLVCCHATSNVLMCYLPNNIMDLNLSSRGTFVTAPCFLFYEKNIKFTKSLTQMTWFLVTTLFDITHTDKDTQDTMRPIDTCYVHTAATCIELN